MKSVMSGLETIQGFTLVEALAVVALTGAIMYGLVRVVPSLHRLFGSTQAQAQTNLQARAAMDTMKQLIAQAKASTLLHCACNGGLNGGLCTSACGTNASPDIPSNSQIDFSTIDGHSRSFYWGEDHTLHMTIDNVSDTVLCQNVSAVHFDWTDPYAVSIQMTLEVPLDNSGQRTMTLALPTTVVNVGAT